MGQQIEIEFKNMLEREEFDLLAREFQLKEEDFHEQRNDYFDTPDFSIKEKKAALRIRKKGEAFILTLKEPAETGLLETEQLLDEKTAQAMKEDGVLPEGEVKQQLETLSVPPARLQYFGTLSTWRAEKKFENGLIVLDHSRYLDIEDYELEYEVTDEAAGKISFEALLARFHIPVRTAKNKVRRFYERKYQTRQN
ncbi:CYTH domain-containing protein [Metabacillus sp. GX 13764]|uniref:CYTH domain-containing protein n=1 Tax=Metabacillus kandeliae TaxID=2900151 RepID=UPI001E2CB321|nr:CYTH domain-containing protein [Metabacillus kandeliae]MCD7034986.1 CYTH domain-containing protein [Metabacillus kandeliae]